MGLAIRTMSLTVSPSRLSYYILSLVQSSTAGDRMVSEDPRCHLPSFKVAAQRMLTTASPVLTCLYRKRAVRDRPTGGMLLYCVVFEENDKRGQRG